MLVTAMPRVNCNSNYTSSPVEKARFGHGHRANRKVR